MRFVFIFLIAFCLVWFFFPRKKGEGESAGATLREIALDTVDGADCIVLDGARYYAYQGEDVDGTQLWTWHGRMGEQVGVLSRENSPLPVGGLYQLRGGNGEILLAYLPSDGWTHLWSGVEYGQGTCVVPAAMGDIPVFYKKDSAVASIMEEIRAKYAK